MNTRDAQLKEEKIKNNVKEIRFHIEVTVPDDILFKTAIEEITKKINEIKYECRIHAFTGHKAKN